MKILTLVVILVGISIAAPTGIRDETHYDFNQIEKAYCSCLMNDNIGVVESSLFCVVQMSYQFPDKSFNRIKKVVDYLSVNSENPLIRYKANVAKLYLNNSTLMNQLSEKDLEDGPDFWARLVKNIQLTPRDQILG